MDFTCDGYGDGLQPVTVSRQLVDVVDGANVDDAGGIIDRQMKQCRTWPVLQPSHAHRRDVTP